MCYDIMYERKSTVKAMKMAYTNQYRNTLVEDFLLQYTTICFCTRLMIIIIPTNYSQLFVSMIQSILYFLCSNQATHTHTQESTKFRLCFSFHVLEIWIKFLLEIRLWINK